jgi:hypothetical protein
MEFYDIAIYPDQAGLEQVGACFVVESTILIPLIVASNNCYPIAVITLPLNTYKYL